MPDRAASFVTPDFRNEPYWWDVAKPRLEEQTAELPAAAEAVIVGAGITGTMAALKLARGGVDVVVLDRQAIGEGASRRNAGYIGRTLKRSVAWLEAQAGVGRGIAIYRELDQALKFVGQVVTEEGIDCHHQICGRFIAANSAAHLKLLLDDLADMKRCLGFPYEPLGKGEVRRELGSALYAGGAVIPDLGSIHPGLYHLGLVTKAKAAGVRFLPQIEVLGFETGDGQKKIETNKGSIKARHLIVTTNGYTTRKLSWHARRVVPFRGFILATEILPAGLIDRILPKRRTYLDTKLSIDFIRPAPDSERILFGGMTGCGAQSVMEILPALRQRLTTILPDLKDLRISRAWDGLCAGTFDFLPHLGRHDGVHYALGYNFAGVPIGSLFGAKLAARILGQSDGHSALDVGTFPSAFFYQGNPWFVPLAMHHYARQDRKLAGEDEGSGLL